MKFKNLFFVALVLVVALIASRDLFKPGYFSIHDDLQVGRLYEMDLCFRDGQFPCRWVPDMGYGYGYPLFNYYPPLPFYFGEIVHLMGFSFLDSTKAMFIAGFLISGVLMFLFGRKLWGDWGGLLSAVLYVFAPYHSVDVYVRGAANEHWALAFLPGVCWAVYEIIDRRGRKFVPIMAIFLGLLLLSHNLMAFIFTPVIGAFVLLLIWLKKKDFKEKIKSLFLGGLWGVGLAAFFTLPVILEKRFVHVETMLMGYFNYLAHYVSIGKLLFTRFWGYGSSGWLQETGMPFQVGFPHWPLTVLVFICGNFLFWKKKIKKEIFFIFYFLFFIFLGSLFMVHPRSVQLWKNLPMIEYLQFPWRFLTLVIFSISVMGGGVIYLLKNIKAQIFCSLLLVFLTIGLNIEFFRVEKIFPMTDTNKLFSAKGWNKLQTDAIFDYLPIYAKAPPGGPAPDRPEIKKGKAETFDIEKGTDWYRFKINVQEEARVQVPVYDFPGWRVKVDGKKTAVSHNNFLGLITITVSQGEHLIALNLKNTPVRFLGNLISIISLVLLYFRFKRKKEPISSR